MQKGATGFTLLLFLSAFFFVIGLVWSFSANQSNYKADQLSSIVIDDTTREIFASGTWEQQELFLRQLVREKNTAYALQVLSLVDIPKDGQAHLLAHSIGEATYEKYAMESLHHCQNDMLNGCVHGLMIAAVADVGTKGIQNMVESCKVNTDFEYFMCSHAAGHGFMALHVYDLDLALAECDALPGLDLVERDHCYNGVFMENVLGEHDGLTPFDRETLSQSDLLLPCNQVENKYKSACYLNQVAWWQQVFEGDLASMGKQCSAVPEEFKLHCANSLGRVIASLSPRIQDHHEYCKLAFSDAGTSADRDAKKLQLECVSSIAVSKYALGDHSGSVQTCLAHENEQEQDTCLQLVENFSNYLDPDLALCEKYSTISICQ
jgi:hypothetical protein